MSETRMTTGDVRFSYVHVWEPQEPLQPGGEKKYAVTLIIDPSTKSGKDTLKRIEACIEAAKEIGKAKCWDGKIPKGSKQNPFFEPLRDADDEGNENPEYEGMMFIKASSKDKPGIVDDQINDIITQSEFYSGCYGRASISFFPFAKGGGVGVGCSLGNVQKTADGDSLGGSRSKPSEDFTKVGGGSKAKDKPKTPVYDDDELS